MATVARDTPQWTSFTRFTQFRVNGFFLSMGAGYDGGVHENEDKW